MKKATKPTRKAFSERMVEYGKDHTDFVVLEADIGYSTYTYLFGQAFPNRYFNMGIAEANMVSAAAGLAADGRPVIVSSYGVFLSMRAVESMRTYICYPDLNVKFLSSHGGVTAAIDGATHQATEDMAIVSSFPNMKVLCPADSASAAKILDLSLETPGPVFVRLMRDPLYEIYDDSYTFKIGGSHVVRKGSDVTLVTYGDMVFQSLEAASILEEKGISVEVIDMYSIKPIDKETLLASVKKTGAVVVAENHQKKNGLGYAVPHYLAKIDCTVPFSHIGLDDTFAESGDYLQVLEAYGLSARCITEAIESTLARKQGV
nr:transketolase C-terminal domain-containing protein [uncultured Sphaerochaeta sp.]